MVYVLWQFLCADCRVELHREMDQESERVQVLAQVERQVHAPLKLAP